MNKIITAAFIILCVSSILCSTEDTEVVYVKIGSNKSLETTFLPDPPAIPHIIWYKEVFNSIFGPQTPSYYFSGVKYCEISESKNQIWDHYPAEFNCINKSLNFFNLKPSDSGLYQAQVINNSIIYSNYIYLYVIDLPAPQCVVTSYYLEVQHKPSTYCLIEINCSKSEYPAEVFFNGKRSNLHHYVTDTGNKPLPNYFTTTIKAYGLTQTYNHSYEFNDLCNDIIALETSADFTPIFIVTIVVSVIVIILGITYLIYHCRTLKTHKKTKPPEIRLL
ncbi:CR1-beta [simian adenovirus 2]|uniref:CR1-beta n=1 Tax=simian adenovirus 2 TaxID=38418 RepID=A0A679A8G6_9ADEN|nr:CR1-beta [Simian adenovirus 2]